MAGDTQNVRVDQLLRELEAGDREAMTRLLPIVYAELHVMARRQLRRLRPGQTLNTTGLVHEAYLRLVGHADAGWKDRRHFVAVAATAMRQIVVDEARSKAAKKRGGGRHKVSLDPARLPAAERAAELIDLDEALEQLSKVDARLSTVVELRFFTGLSVPETAEVLEVSPSTVKREWRTARALLYQMMCEPLAAGVP